MKSQEIAQLRQNEVAAAFVAFCIGGMFFLGHSLEKSAALALIVFGLMQPFIAIDYFRGRQGKTNE